MNRNSRIFVSGHRGMVGSALLRQLIQKNYSHLITATSDELDLRDINAVESFFYKVKPEIVFLAAAKVGGIKLNSNNQFNFLLQNLLIQNNVISAAIKFDVQRLIFIGSASAYPVDLKKPIREYDLLRGPLEASNEGYSLAKLTGLKLIEYANKELGKKFLTVMPANLYGIRDNFDEKKAHVIAAAIRKIHHSKLIGKNDVQIWGSGNSTREFVYVDDLAEACVFLMDNYFDNEHINIGSRENIRIIDLYKLVSKVIGYECKFTFDTNQPDSQGKVLDSTKLYNLGFIPKTSLEEGIRLTYNWYLKEVFNS
jgi:GDP-L-fucose synthase